MVVLVWWCLQVGTEPGFKKEENVLRWNVHQLHFLWAGEWGLGMGLYGEQFPSTVTEEMNFNE